MSDKKYNRILLKISGEALAGDAKVGINDAVLKEISTNIKAVAHCAARDPVLPYLSDNRPTA